MEQLKNYIIMPEGLPNCITELSGDKLTINHSFWYKFCTSHNSTTNNYVIRTIFRKIFGITYIEDKDSIMGNYNWDDEKGGYYSETITQQEWIKRKRLKHSRSMEWNN